MWRMLIYYTSYVAVCILLYSRKFINLFAMRGGKVIGLLAGILLTALLVYLTIDYLHKSKRNAEPVNALDDTPKKKTVSDWLEFYTLLVKRPGNLSDLLYDEAEAAEHSASLLYRTIEDIRGLLKSTFSETDLTYVTYKSAIDEIEEICCSNFESIARRMSVFKKDWMVEHKFAVVYQNEIATFLTYNNEIWKKLEDLTHELVVISDNRQQGDTEKITELINQTQNYVKVRQEVL